MAARKSKLASSVQDMTIEMPREYLKHALCKQVNNQDVVRQLLLMFCSFVDGVQRTCNRVTLFAYNGVCFIDSVISFLKLLVCDLCIGEIEKLNVI